MLSKEQKSEVKKEIKNRLEDIRPYVKGDERPTDLMDCGYADGQWNTYIDILNMLGISHRYKEV